MVYDIPKNYIGDTYHNSPNGLEDGDELELERGGVLVQVAERIAQEETNVSALVTRRTPKAIEQGEGQSARQPRPLQPRPTTLGISQRTPGKWMGWTGRAQIPQESPFQQRKTAQEESENDWEQGRAAKRQRQEDDEHVPLYQILKTSRPGIRSATSNSSTISSPLKPGTANNKVANRVNTSANVAKKKTALPPGQARFQVKEVIDIASSPEETELPQQGEAPSTRVQRGQAPVKANIVQAKLAQTVNGRSLGPLRPEVVRAFKPPASQVSQGVGTQEQEKGGVYNSSSPARPGTAKKARAPPPAKINVVQAKLAQSMAGRQLGPVRPELVRTFKPPTSQPIEAPQDISRAQTPTRIEEAVLPLGSEAASDIEKPEHVGEKPKLAVKPRRPAVEVVTPQRLPPSSPPVSTTNHLQPPRETSNADLTMDEKEKTQSKEQTMRPMKALRLGGSSRPKMLLFQQTPKSRPATPIEGSKTSKDKTVVVLKDDLPTSNTNKDNSKENAQSSPAFGTMDPDRPLKEAPPTTAISQFRKRFMFGQDDSDEEDAFELVVAPSAEPTHPRALQSHNITAKPGKPSTAQVPPQVAKEVVAESVKLPVEPVPPPVKSAITTLRAPGAPAVADNATQPIPATIVGDRSRPLLPAATPKITDTRWHHPDIDNLMTPLPNITVKPVTSLTSTADRLQTMSKSARASSRPGLTEAAKNAAPKPNKHEHSAPSNIDALNTMADSVLSVSLNYNQVQPSANGKVTVPRAKSSGATKGKTRPPPPAPLTAPCNEDISDLIPPPSTAPTGPSPQKRQAKKPLTRATTISNPARAAREKQQQEQQQAVQSAVVVDEVAFAKEKRIADEKKATGPWTKEAWDMFGWCPPQKKEELGWEYGQGGSTVQVPVTISGENIAGDQSGRMDQVRALGGFGRANLGRQVLA